MLFCSFICFDNHYCQILPELLGQSSKKKLGRKPASTPHQLKKSSKKLFIQIIGLILANYC
jgi:hypothetical protein